MKEIDEKRQQHKMLSDLKLQDGWLLFHTQLSVRAVADQVKLVAPPDQVSAEMRGYLAGRVKGMSEAAGLLDTLLEGLKSEIELLATQEQVNGHEQRDPDLDAASSASGRDTFGFGASHADPFADGR